jgi:ribose 5-phosphate isomerase B
VNVAFAADHAGYALKQDLIPSTRSLGHRIDDLGTHDQNPVDYPDVARDVGRAVLSGESERGVLICGSGVGASVAANKLRGIRAGLCHDTYSARQGVEHDDMNVLVLGARVIGVELARELVGAFLEARFSEEERHRRRVAKINALDGERR